MKTSDTSVQTQRQFPLTVNNKVKMLSLLKRKNSNHQIPFKQFDSLLNENINSGIIGNTEQNSLEKNQNENHFKSEMKIDSEYIHESSNDPKST